MSYARFTPEVRVAIAPCGEAPVVQLSVPVMLTTGVAVAVGVAVAEGIRVAAGTGDAVAVLVDVGVLAAVLVAVAVLVGVLVAVLVAVTVAVFVAVAVLVLVAVTVAVFVAVAVLVGVGVGVWTAVVAEPMHSGPMAGGTQLPKVAPGRVKVAVFVIDAGAPALTVTTSWKTELPGGIPAAAVQVTVPAANAQAQPAGGVTLTNDVPAGIGSVTTATFGLMTAPGLVTVIV